MNKFINIFLLLCIIELTTQPAHAYLDPGTGSLIAQIAVATLATIAVFFKAMWQTIKSFLKIGSKNTEIEEEDE